MTNEPPVRRRLSKLAEAIGYLLAAVVIFVVGKFVNAFAAFALLPAVLGFCTVQFFRARSRQAQPAQWPALLAGNGLLLAFLLSLLFLGFETYYRFVCDQTDAMANTLVSVAWYQRHVHANNIGLRDNVDYPMARTHGRRRVTFVGDSCVVGLGVKDVEDRFANQIRHRHPEWEIHAVAKPGLDTSTEVDIVHNLTVSNHYELDQVVLVYHLNDIGEVMPGWVAGYKQMMADPFRKSWLCENSYVVNLFYHRWQLRRNAYLQKYFDEVEAAYKGPLWEMEKFGLTAFINMTRIRGGRLLVVTLPFLDQALRFKFAHEQLDRFWSERGVPHLDLLATYSNVPPAKLVVNSHDAHPNEYAHALAAEAIDQFLRREISERVEDKTNAP